MKKDEKTSKKVEKVLKKVLTNENIYDILHERSTEERQKQRSWKIEQQEIEVQAKIASARISKIPKNEMFCFTTEHIL